MAALQYYAVRAQRAFALFAVVAQGNFVDFAGTFTWGLELYEGF